MKKVIPPELVRSLREQKFTWAEIGFYIAKAHDRKSKDGQIIPYTETALRVAFKKCVTHTGESSGRSD